MLKFVVVLGVVVLFVGVYVWVEVIKVGVMGGLYVQIMEVVKQVVVKGGLEICIVEFFDYVQLNVVFVLGDFDVNSYQYDLYLQVQVKDCGYKLIKVVDIVMFLMGIYLKCVKLLVELKLGVCVVVLNDLINGGCVLLLLQKQGLLKLCVDVGLKVMLFDIVDNLCKLKIVEFDVVQILCLFGDVDVVVININYVMEVGLKLKQDVIVIEGLNGLYVNIFVICEMDWNKLWVVKLIVVYYLVDVKQFIEGKFGGVVIVVW